MKTAKTKIKRIRIQKGKLLEAVSGDKVVCDFLFTTACAFVRAVEEHRSNVISTTTSKAMHLHQRSGRRMSSRLPYGWKADPDDPSRMLPDKAERKAIQWMIKLRSQGFSLGKIGDTLEKAGLCPRPDMERPLSNVIFRFISFFFF